MPTLRDTMKLLRAEARPDQLAGMARFGIVGKGRLGVAIPVLRRMARKIGRDHDLALKLWRTGVPDARILAGMVADPARLTKGQMDSWVRNFDSWDVCDQVCLNLFSRSPHAWDRIKAWADRPEEFVRRAAFALIACVAWHDDSTHDRRFTALIPLIAGTATDERNYVRKAVNWALRHIGKRNPALNRAAISAARKIARLNSRSARWIAADALRELTNPAVQARVKLRAERKTGRRR